VAGNQGINYCGSSWESGHEQLREWLEIKARTIVRVAENQD